jgi:hypothetical protein
MEIDRRELLTGLAAAVAAVALPAEALAEAVAESVPALPEPEEVVYTLDTVPNPYIWTWQQLHERLAPRKAQIIAAARRLDHPARRASRRAGSRSRVRARLCVA